MDRQVDVPEQALRAAISKDKVIDPAKIGIVSYTTETGSAVGDGFASDSLIVNLEVALADQEETQKGEGSEGRRRKRWCHPTQTGC